MLFRSIAEDSPAVRLYSPSGTQDAYFAGFGWQDTIIFFCDDERFRYRSPRELVDPRSGVVCIPNNYQYGEGRALDEGWLRVTESSDLAISAPRSAASPACAT